jgi:cell shape-determining protein MreC
MLTTLILSALLLCLSSLYFFRKLQKMNELLNNANTKLHKKEIIVEELKEQNMYLNEELSFVKKIYKSSLINIENKKRQLQKM